MTDPVIPTVRGRSDRRALSLGSLFSGIGGFELGFERAGFDIRWQVEIDPWARAVLAKHWPHVHRHDDIRTAGAHNLEAVDVLCGGFPCTDISLAGKGAGITGPQSGLWAEYARLIRELRPRYVVVENVAALLARGLGRVLGDLAACGYDAEWDCIPAAAVGAPHRRDRLWLVAYPTLGGQPMRGRSSWDTGHAALGGQDVADTDGGRCERVGKPEWADVEGAPGREPDRCGRAWGRQPHAAAHPEQRRGVPHAVFAGLEGHERGQLALAAYRRSHTDPARSGWWATEPHVGRVAHGVPTRVDRLRGLGNAIVPQIAEWLARRILDAEARRAA